MTTKDDLIERINEYIRTNHQQQITGAVLNYVLQGFVDYSDDNSVEGVIVPSTPIVISREDGLHPSTIDLKFSIYQKSKDGLLDEIPEGYKMSYQIGGNPEVDITYGHSTLNISLDGIQPNQIFKATLWRLGDDEKIIHAVNIPCDALTNYDGRNGAYRQYIYKSVEGDTPPSKPQSSGEIIPEGWSESVPESQTGYNIWMSFREITYNNDNTQIYGAWSDPLRMTGDDGQPGTDGKSIEFIYTRNNNGQAPDAPPSPNTDDWHGTDIYGVEWTDNPQGVSADMMYEYVCQRTKTNNIWGEYLPDPAAIWSKWGEKGQDGDGVEYVFARTETDIAPIVTGNPPHDRTTYSDPDYCPSISGARTFYATDEPQGVNSTERFEWVISRKSINGGWPKYEEGAAMTLWANWSEGEKGDSGVSYQLVPISEVVDVKIASDNNYESIYGALYADLSYAVCHGEGDNITYLNNLDGYTLQIEPNAGKGLYSSDVTEVTDLKYIINMKTDSGNEYGLGSDVRYYQLVRDDNNLLKENYDDEHDWNYYNLIYSNNPLRYLTVTLFNNGNIVDRRRVDVIFGNDSVFNIGKCALNSVYQGLTSGTGQYTKEGFSQLHQDWENIRLSVNNIESYNAGGLPENTQSEQYCYKITQNKSTPQTPTKKGSWNDGWVPSGWEKNYNGLNVGDYVFMSSRKRVGGYNEQSEWEWVNDNPEWGTPILFDRYGINRGAINSAQLSVSADEILSTVSSNYPTSAGMETYVSSTVQQTADSILTQVSNVYATNDFVTSQIEQSASGITLYVTSAITDGLLTTGIDIETGKITLNSENTNINGNLNVYNNDDGISLFTEEGDLKAQLVAKDLTGTGDINLSQNVSTSGTINDNETISFECKLGLLQAGTKLTLSDYKTKQVYTGAVWNPWPYVIYSRLEEQHNFPEVEDNKYITLSEESGGIIASGDSTTKQVIFDIQNTGKYSVSIKTKLKNIVYLGFEYTPNSAEWDFKYELSGSSYLMIGRDGIIVSDSDNRLFRVDGNGISLRRGNDAIFFKTQENSSDEITTMYRGGFNGDGYNESIPFDNYAKTIVVFDNGHQEKLGPGERKVDGNGWYEMKYGEAGTVIMAQKTGIPTGPISFGINLPNTGANNIAPGYNFKLVHASINYSSIQPSAPNIITIQGDGDRVILCGTTASTAGGYINVANWGVYEILWTGSEWVLS